ncbi:MAG: aspartate aminotransferase family protein [Pseudomonadota bacterium]|uniref:aspartate aminotransferase family protein n=1 Tax=Thermithiobacillus tepidarius TaxID=929 RepID=UPI00048A47E1|nr:aspartate aminotransferase family protein [Thermithiobacillus tepidarius]
MTEHLMNTYARLPVAFVRGEGAWLWDEAGKRYLDALSGVAVCGLGHAHPAVAQAVCQQAQTLIHTSNIYRMPMQERLAADLCQLSGLDQVFFCNSGAEANEAAIKLARLYGHEVRQVAEPKILVFDGSFHGRTLATLSATGNRKIQQGFEPLVSGFVRSPYNDLAAVEALARANPDIVAVLVEPVQGEGGVRLPSAGFLPGLRELCDRHGWLLMLDEVQTGMGRTGQFFGFQHYAGLRPDVMTLAKGLGNGVPIGALLARVEVARLFVPGKHGSTFGGGQLAIAAAQAVLDTMRAEQLPARAERTGASLRHKLRQRLAGILDVKEIRGQGLMLGIELGRPAASIVQRALDRGVLINVTAERVIRLLPPLIFTEEQADLLVETLGTLLEEGL